MSSTVPVNPDETYGPCAHAHRGMPERTKRVPSEMWLDICIPEHRVPETPQPWFQVEQDGVTGQGQAKESPEPQPDGTLRYRLKMERIERQSSEGPCSST